MSDHAHPNYEAGRRATKTVYGVTPDMTREGGSIPITITLQVLGLGRKGGPHPSPSRCRCCGWCRKEGPITIMLQVLG